jgi:acyl-homoserine lactone synthase
MFEDRKKLFVDLLRWSVPVTDGRFERDGYDSEHAIYLIALDEQGCHAGSMRLLPTTEPHILTDLFPELCEGEMPRGASIFEVTRLCLPTRHRTAQRLSIRNHLISAMVDYALSEEIEVLTGVVEANFLRQILEMGWRCRSLGEHRAEVGSRPLGAFEIEIGPDTPDLLKSRGIYVPDTIEAVETERKAA